MERRDVDRRPAFRARVKVGRLGAEVAPIVIDALPVEEPVDQLERFLETLELLVGFRPSIPSGDSLSDSPEPTPRNARPGYMTSSVAKAWATRAGW